MPTVGGKKFSYSKAGQKAAKLHAKKTGQKVNNRPIPEIASDPITRQLLLHVLNGYK